MVDLLASSLPGIGKSIPVGSEFVSKTAIIGIPNFCLCYSKRLYICIYDKY